MTRLAGARSNAAAGAPRRPTGSSGRKYVAGERSSPSLSRGDDHRFSRRMAVCFRSPRNHLRRPHGRGGHRDGWPWSAYVQRGSRDARRRRRVPAPRGRRALQHNSTLAWARRIPARSCFETMGRRPAPIARRQRHVFKHARRGGRSGSRFLEAQAAGGVFRHESDIPAHLVRSSRGNSCDSGDFGDEPSSGVPERREPPPRASLSAKRRDSRLAHRVIRGSRSTVADLLRRQRLEVAEPRARSDRPRRDSVRAPARSSSLRLVSIELRSPGRAREIGER